MFIWREDNIGIVLAKCVLDAADRGVKITLSKDLIGGIFEHAEEHRLSLFHPKLPPLLAFKSAVLAVGYPMKGKPSKVIRTLHPLAHALLHHPNVQMTYQVCQNDHSKFFIIDDEILCMGGINVEEKEFTSDLLGRPYHDFMVFLHSETLVSQFKTCLEQGKTQCKSSQGVTFIMNRFRHGQKHFQAKSDLLALINKAQTILHIVMAYIGDPQITQAIVSATQRGVCVMLYTPKYANLQNDLNRYHLSHLFKSCSKNLTLYLCADMIHGKLVWIDENEVTFGSTNLNKQAMETLQELNILYSAVNFGHKTNLQKAIQRIQERSICVSSSKQIAYRPFVAWIESLA